MLRGCWLLRGHTNKATMPWRGCDMSGSILIAVLLCFLEVPRGLLVPRAAALDDNTRPARTTNLCG